MPRLNLFGVGPHQVAVRTLNGDLLVTLDGADLIDRLELRGKTAVHAEDFVANDGSDVEQVEDLSEHLPGSGRAVLLEALVVETVDLSDLSGLVVTA